MRSLTAQHQRHYARSRGRSGAALCALACAVVAMLIPAHAAAAPNLLREFAETGSEAGQTRNPGGVAADRGSGHLFVADSGNNRIVEFTAWGEFVKAWGWDVVQSGPGDDTTPPENQFETCIPARGDLCKAGIQGSGRGQLAGSLGIAVDSVGDVYVADRGLLSEPNLRVQKFDPGTDEEETQFVLMFGGAVNETSGGNLCPRPGFPEDACKAGNQGSAEGHFGAWAIGSFLAVDTLGTASTADDRVYVGDEGRIQRFDAGGEFQSVLPDPGGILAGKTVKSLALAPDGDLYVALCTTCTFAQQALPGVRRIDPATGAEVGSEREVADPQAVASDSGGGLYVFDSTGTNSTIRMFDDSGEEVNDGEFPFSDGFDTSTGLATNEVSGAGGIGLYISNGNFTRSFIRAYGPAPDKWPPPVVPPQISASYALSVDTDTALVQAHINPRFWGDTSYYVQYGTEPCSLGGCDDHPAAPGASLGAGLVDITVTTKGVFLDGLEPGTTYHFRFVAQSSGGGPVFGPDRTFTTFQLPAPPNTGCPNQAFRNGASAALADCRAYEMVSPVDKEGADIFVLRTAQLNTRARIEQSSADGGKLTYSVYKAYGDAAAAPYSSQYIATRGAAGWSNHSISAPRGPTLFSSTAADSNYRAFSSDLCQAWMFEDTGISLATGAVPGLGNLYRRESCGAEADSYEALTTIAPLDGGGLYRPTVGGFSADGSHTVFNADVKLTPEAAGSGVKQVYEHHRGELRLVSVLPDGGANQTPAGTGDGRTGIHFREAGIQHAVSANGSRIFWTVIVGQAGRIYVRIDPDPNFDGDELTTPVSPGSNAIFRAAAADGSRAVYTAGSQLHSFDVDSEATMTIADEVVGVMGVSEDARRIYFASRGVLDPEANSAGDSAQPGQPNLYLYRAGEEASISFIATLAEADLNGRLGPLGRQPYTRTSRITPDGGHAAFMSVAPLTGYDNIDAVSGEADAEVFRYDAASDELLCVSCNPSGVRPRGRVLVDPGDLSTGWGAAQIPGWPSDTHASRVLSDDGRRLFFESFEALVLADTNGKQDVYQWEQAGSGDCTVTAPAFSEPAGGCVSLISSGTGLVDARFVDASASGGDVFFTTQSSLVEADPGLVDIYNARVGGGYPPPPPPLPDCTGDACQPSVQAPIDPTPASASFRGAENPAPRARCSLAARRAKGLARQAKRLRRAARRVESPQRRRRMRQRAARTGRSAKRLSRTAKRCRRARTRVNRTGGGSR